MLSGDHGVRTHFFGAGVAPTMGKLAFSLYVGRITEYFALVDIVKENTDAGRMAGFEVKDRGTGTTG